MSNAWYEDEKEDLTGWHIWCFDCRVRVMGKNSARRSHRNHEVDYVRSDGERHAFSNDVPKVR